MQIDFETEINVLAGLLLSEKLLYEGLNVLSVKHFQDEVHQTIYETITSLAERGRPDFRSVYKELRGKANDSKLLNLNSSPISDNTFDYWMARLQESYIRRNYKEAAQEILNIADSERPINEITELIEQRIMNVHALESTDQIITPQEAGKQALAEFEKRLTSTEKIHGIALSRPVATGGIPGVDGFPGLDQIFKGLRGGDLVIIAARTGDGKTALAQNIVRHASIHQNYQTFYQNTEMKPEEIVFRFVAQMSGKSFEGIDGGDLNTWDRTMVRQAFERYCESRIYISELPVLTPEKSRSLARQFKMKHGHMDLLVIDYIGRMEMQQSKGKQEWQVLRDIAKDCKRLAQELNSCVILISQLTEEGKLQGAKAIANEADGVFYLEPIDSEEVNEAPYGATHKLVPAKARRGNKDKKMWISFNKDKMYMTEVVR